MRKTKLVNHKNHLGLIREYPTDLTIIENGTEFKNLYDLFYKKFEWVRRDPWKEGEAPFLKIIPSGKTSWGLN